MKILVISQYFYPENFRINELCFKLQDQEKIEQLIRFLITSLMHIELGNK